VVLGGYSGPAADTGALPLGDFVRFPPYWRHVLLPAGPPSATRLGMSLYSASRPLPLLAQRALWVLARMGGARVLPGPREQWRPPMEPDVFAGLWAEWRRLVGRPIDGVAVSERRRAATVLLLCAGNRSLSVHVHADVAALLAGQRVSDAALEQRPVTFRVPRCVGGGQADSGLWHWAAYEAIAQRPHSPGRTVNGAMGAEIADLVESAVPRPAGVPLHWRGAHGDLTPWTLRRAGAVSWLTGWERLRWAPPDTDLIYFTAVTTALRGRVRSVLPLAPKDGEAGRFCADLARQRLYAGDDDVQLNSRLLKLLDPAPVRVR
jgi:hypothetical protein